MTLCASEKKVQPYLSGTNNGQIKKQNNAGVSLMKTSVDTTGIIPFELVIRETETRKIIAKLASNMTL